MVEVEKRGVPTVSWTADGFIRDAHRSAESFGLPALPIATMPEPFTTRSGACGPVDIALFRR